MPAATGADTRAVFLWEDNGFAASPTDSSHKTFGADVTVDSAELSNNPTNFFDPGSREAAERVAQAFDGSWSVSFTLANPWIWRAVIDTPSTSGTGPYTHTFSGETPSSMRILLGSEVNTNERVLKGCVASTCTLDVADNGSVDVTLSGAYADEDETSGSLQSQVSESFEPLLFHDGSLTVDSTTYTLVQSGTLTIENNIDLVPALGQRVPADYSPKVRSTTVDWSQIVNTVDGDSVLQQSYGGGTTPSTRMDSDDEVDGTLVFDNGESGANQNKQTVKFNSTAFPDDYGRTGTGDPAADYIEEQTLFVRQVTVEAVNDTSTAP